MLGGFSFVVCVSVCVCLQFIVGALFYVTTGLRAHHARLPENKL